MIGSKSCTKDSFSYEKNIIKESYLQSREVEREKSPVKVTFSPQKSSKYKNVF